MRPKIYLFGDSITEESFSFVDGGWGASLVHHFSRTVDVVVRGYGGYNTRWALRVLDKVFPPPEKEEAPVAVTVFFGANDACLPDRSCAFQHVPIDEYRNNLSTIVSLLKSTKLGGYGPVKQPCTSYIGEVVPGGSTKGIVDGLMPMKMLMHEKRWPGTNIILITPPPIDEDGRLLHPYVENPSGLPERTNEVAGAYAKACVAVARQCGILVVDLWTKMQEFPSWQKAYLSDGLHLTQGGNRLVFEEVIAKLREAGLSLETLPVDLPRFDEIDLDDPLKAFE